MSKDAKPKDTILRRKPPPSMTPGAIRGRVHRERRSRNVMMVLLPIAARDINELERGGRLDLRLEKVSPAEAISQALQDILQELRAGTRFKK